MKYFLNDPDFKKTFIATVITTILVVYLLQPLLNVFLAIIRVLGENVYSGIEDSIYYSASLGQRDWLVVLVFFFVLAIPIVLSVPLLRHSRRRKDQEEQKQSMGLLRTVWASVWLNFALYVVCAGSLSMYAFIDLQLTTSFKQRLTVLAPCISDQEVEEFRASWASMETAEDHARIQRGLEAAASECGIELPRPLL